MVNADLPPKFFSFLSYEDRKEIFELFMNHCGNSVKVASQLLNKKPQMIYRYTTGSGRNRLVPNSETTKEITDVLLTKGYPAEKIELLGYFKTSTERLCESVTKVEEWLSAKGTELKTAEFAPEIQLLRIGANRMVQRIICSNCGLGAMFPMHTMIDGKKVILCIDCKEDFFAGKQLKIMKKECEEST
jgi:hypothetical protein